MAEVPFLLSNREQFVNDGLDHISNGADEIHAAVAYLSSPGLIESWLGKGIRVKLLVALQPPTTPVALQKLSSAHPTKLEIKYYSSKFHSKLFLFLKANTPVSAQVGSSNLTRGGLHRNLETNVILRDHSQIKELETHFQDAWRDGGILQPDDITNYAEYCAAIRELQKQVDQKRKEFKFRIVLPQVKRPSSRKASIPKVLIRQEAIDYLSFWRVVDNVRQLVGTISQEEWPDVPQYLAVDHFWHWIKTKCDRTELEPLRANPAHRDQTLPDLFSQYARWDKGQTEGSFTRKMKNISDFICQHLSETALPNLTAENARKIYRSLHSGQDRARRFKSDEHFISRNTIESIKNALGYLLWSDDDVIRKISALLQGGPYHLKELGPSGVQELLGWANPEAMPIRNSKADAALKLLGYEFQNRGE
jgi:HKD family nuclease